MTVDQEANQRGFDALLEIKGESVTLNGVEYTALVALADSFAPQDYTTNQETTVSFSAATMADPPKKGDSIIQHEERMNGSVQVIHTVKDVTVTRVAYRCKCKCRREKIAI